MSVCVFPDVVQDPSCTSLPNDFEEGLNPMITSASIPPPSWEDKKLIRNLQIIGGRQLLKFNLAHKSLRPQTVRLITTRIIHIRMPRQQRYL